MHNEDICRHFHGMKDAYEKGFDIRAMNDRIGEVLNRMESLQDKIEKTVQQLTKEKDVVANSNITRLDCSRYHNHFRYSGHEICSCPVIIIFDVVYKHLQ